MLFNSKIEDLQARADAINHWLSTTSGAQLDAHLHLDRNGAECAYWHMGYQQALNDIIRMSTNAPRVADIADIPN